MFRAGRACCICRRLRFHCVFCLGFFHICIGTICVENCQTVTTSGCIYYVFFMWHDRSCCSLRFCLRHSLFGFWMLRSYFFRRLVTPECHWLRSTTKYVMNRNTHRHTVKTVSKYHRNLWLHRSCSCLSICKAWKTFALWLQRGHRLRNICADVIRVCVCWIQLHFGKCLFYFILMAAQARAEKFLTWF